MTGVLILVVGVILNIISMVHSYYHFKDVMDDHVTLGDLIVSFFGIIVPYIYFITFYLVADPFKIGDIRRRIGDKVVFKIKNK